jgi:hypothetical protein
MTEQQFLDALNHAMKHNVVPIQVIARTMYNLERLANAQDIIAGLRKTPVFNAGNGSVDPQSENTENK